MRCFPTSQVRSSCSGASTPIARGWDASSIVNRAGYYSSATRPQQTATWVTPTGPQLHLADERPLTAADLMSAKLPMPPRIAMVACASGGDYQFDEATGLVAAMILGGAQLVTATLWSLPTAAGYRQFARAAGS